MCIYRYTASATCWPATLVLGERISGGKLCMTVRIPKGISGHGRKTRDRKEGSITYSLHQEASRPHIRRTGVGWMHIPPGWVECTRPRPGCCVLFHRMSMFFASAVSILQDDTPLPWLPCARRCETCGGVRVRFGRRHNHADATSPKTRRVTSTSFDRAVKVLCRSNVAEGIFPPLARHNHGWHGPCIVYYSTQCVQPPQEASTWLALLLQIFNEPI